jgi:predicted DNA-binding transcriptional regulator AlpA
MENRFEHLITEPNLCELLGIERSTLDKLRNTRGFPYIRVTSQARIYLERDVMRWLVRQRREARSETEDNAPVKAHLVAS